MHGIIPVWVDERILLPKHVSFTGDSAVGSPSKGGA